MKITGKKINKLASPGWLFDDYYVAKKRHSNKVSKNWQRLFSKSARRFVKNETAKLIKEAA